MGIVVNDLVSAAEFFVTHFEATIAFHMDQFLDETGESATRMGAKKGASFALTMLEIGQAKLELVQWWPCLGYEESRRKPAPNVQGSAHLALGVADVQQAIDRMRTVEDVTVLSDAVALAGGQTPPLTNAFFLTPWGLLVELVNWATETDQAS